MSTMIIVRMETKVTEVIDLSTVIHFQSGISYHLLNEEQRERYQCGEYEMVTIVTFNDGTHLVWRYEDMTVFYR